MNLHCKCGNKIKEKDFIIDPTGTWCSQCWSISQRIIDEWEQDNEDQSNIDVDDDFIDENE